jgi:hypothetical protein
MSIGWGGEEMRTNLRRKNNGFYCMWKNNEVFDICFRSKYTAAKCH